MKAFAAAMGILLGLAAVGLIGYLVVPRFVRGAPVVPAVTTGPTDLTVGGPPRPGQSIAPPQGEREKLRAELQQKRAPFFHYLYTNWSGVILKFAVLDDPDTLDVVVPQDDEATLNQVISGAIAPSAHDYGFRRVRLMVRTAAGSVEPFQVVAEATCDPENHWTIYRK